MGQQRTRGQNEPSDEPAFTFRVGRGNRQRSWRAAYPTQAGVAPGPTHVATTRLVSSRLFRTISRARLPRGALTLLDCTTSSDVVVATT